MNAVLKTEVKKYQILVIDDEPSILKSLEREINFWGADKDVEVITFRFPIDALKHLQEHHNLSLIHI